jgi:hypothetical protein
VGAKTVKGPGLLSVSMRFAMPTAATRVSKEPAAMAVSIRSAIVFRRK